ncbi:unnamed protein product [Parnassius apollo]|uniref:(apollo) hypothetical protein n=1 Tax=Parnassius apollo TaxID=110799 RepID=A0A8S3XPC1_PARAO|nr:unnamed protein product [Parnassius apollo]
MVKIKVIVFIVEEIVSFSDEEEHIVSTDNFTSSSDTDTNLNWKKFCKRRLDNSNRVSAFINKASVQKLPQPWLLMYADDIAMVDGNKGRFTRRVHAWREALENGGLKLNVAKTEYMACNSTDLTSLRIGDDTVERTDHFRYLGSVLDASGDIDRDIKARISAAWAKWSVVMGVICDPKISE